VPDVSSVLDKTRNSKYIEISRRVNRIFIIVRKHTIRETFLLLFLLQILDVFFDNIRENRVIFENFYVFAFIIAFTSIFTVFRTCILNRQACKNIEYFLTFPYAYYIYNRYFE